jgi:hydroxymethylpyrimidine pyrophosphatase-like HAD family hydrolase
VFQKVKEINSKEGVLHFRRWKIFSTPWFVINLHGIYQSDEDEHLHSHPWDFASIVLWGSYVEELPGCELNFRSFLDVAYRKHTVYHKILKLMSKKVFTLNIMSKNNHNWGYSVSGIHVEHQVYRKLKKEYKESK